MHNIKLDEERLTELQEELKAVPAEERDAVYEEIVADGGFDPFAEDDDPHALITQLKDEENDSPKRRIINYLLAFIPIILLPFLSVFLSMERWMEGDFTFFLPSMIIMMCITFLLTFIGRIRRSEPLSAYWLGIGLGQITSFPLMMGATLLQIGAAGASLFMLGWLGRLIYKNRHDNLFVAFATLPLVSQLISTIGQPLIFRYLPLEQMSTTFVFRGLFSFVLAGIALGLFFIGRQRSTKWIGVFTIALTTILSQVMLVLFAFSSFSMAALIIVSVMALLILAVPAFFFWRDGRPKEKQPDDFAAEPAVS